MTALVILQFPSAEQAEEFARMAAIQLPPDVPGPTVTLGSAYEVLKENGERFQYLEFASASNWEAWVDPDDPDHHHFLVRPLSEIPEA